jgi:spore germination protein YaaH
VLVWVSLAGAVCAHGGDWKDSPHAAALWAHRATPTHPSLIGDRSAPLIPLREQHPAVGLCRTVYGYLPYWSDTYYLRYDHLTHLACFSVAVNPDGTLGNDHGWPWTSVINNAHAVGTKVILVATLFDDAGIYTLITNESHKQAFFTNIKAKIVEGNADGVNIDFEGGGSSWKPYINGFMSELTTYLHGELPGSEVTFAGPAVNYGTWDLAGLAASCDGIFIMGYAFWGSWSTSSGPNAPLLGGTYNITNTVVSQYSDVTQNHPEKLILGVPYYGHRWITATEDPRSSVINFMGSTRFTNDEPDAQLFGRLWDATSQTPWYRWHSSSGWNQVWYDDAESLGLKYDLAIDHDLQGIGMWALGYDDGRTELWDLIVAKFGGCYVAGDYDGDADVDADDATYAYFCTLGPEMVLPEGHYCLVGDTDDDLDVDMVDFRQFQLWFGQ